MGKYKRAQIIDLLKQGLLHLRLSVVVFADISVYYATYSLMAYLNEVWGQDLTRAAATVNIWRGITFALEPSFVFLADTLVGNYKMLLISGFSSTTGLCLLFMSTTKIVSIGGSCRDYLPECIGSTNQALFYTGLVVLSIGIADHEASIHPFGQDQNTSADQNGRPVLFLRRILVFSVILTVVLYFVKDWALQFLVPAIFSLIATLLFLSASSSFNKKKPLGFPLKAVFTVDWPFASGILQRYRQYPVNSYVSNAALVQPGQEEQSKEVEESPLAFGSIPIWLAFIICGLVSTFGGTFFQEQAANMDQKIGKLSISFEIILLTYEFSKLVFGKLVITKFVYGGTPPFGMEALLFSLLCCITAAKVESLRLDGIRRNETMGVFWLLPQYVLLAGLDSFSEKSVEAYFARVLPISFENYARPFGHAVFGLGYIASTLLVYLVGKIVEGAGQLNWFQDTIDRSRLDNYYWTLAAMSAAPLVLYVLIAIIGCCPSKA